MSWKSRISKIIIVVTSFALGLIIGAYYGGFITGFAPSTIVSFLAGFGFGDLIGVVGVLREWYKDRKEAERAPKIEYECLIENTENHRCSAISQKIGQEGNVVSIRIMNSGLESASHCSGRVDFEMEMDQNMVGIVSQDQTLNWSHFDIGEHTISLSSYQAIGDAIQGYYATKRNQDLIPKKAEWLEICLTVKGHNVAYVLACDRKSKLQFGKKYRVKLQMVGNGLMEKPRTFKLDLRSWDNISFKEA
jgi:hypothetical protein